MTVDSFDLWQAGSPMAAAIDGGSIEGCHLADRREWDRYAGENQAASYTHLFTWGESLAETYRLPVYRLATRSGSSVKVTGILPLLLFRPPAADGRLISLPYTDAAGLAIDDAESGYRLLKGALALAERLGIDHLELRQAGDCTGLVRAAGRHHGWHHRAFTFKTGLKRPLPEAPEVLWAELPAKVRNQVRKARRAGATVQIGGEELLEPFYAVFSENMRDLGSPVHPRELFARLCCGTAGRARIVVVFLPEGPAAAAMVVGHNQTLANPWASSLRRYRPSCPNMLLYWAMLEGAIHDRCRWFDFGRSTPGAATFRFKRQWGAAPEPLVWHVLSRPGKDWDPQRESLCLDQVRKLSLERAKRDGPALRRWISL